jgi:hypothetical protein
MDTCRERLPAHLRSRLADLRTILGREERGLPPSLDLGSLDEYGIDFSYVSPGTYAGQREGYWVWQLSTGGPGDEFRFYADAPRRELEQAEYVFKDWFDFACQGLAGEDWKLIQRLWAHFRDTGQTSAALWRSYER